LERGRVLLCDRTLSIKQIGFELGFKTTSHFIVAFRRQFGLPPQECRQKHDQGSQRPHPPVAEHD
jgi:AraC-like DNA-binding protein